jgi:hypothetical protein
MKQNLQDLERRTRRLTLDKEQQAKLLGHLSKMNEAQVKSAAEILDEHDEEVLQALNKKLADQQVVHDAMVEQMGADIPEPIINQDEFMAFIGDIFSGPETFALFLSTATDEMMVELEGILTKLVPADSKDGVLQLFKEARVQRMAAERREGADMKAALVRQVMKREKQIAELDAVIAQVEGEINGGDKN